MGLLGPQRPVRPDQPDPTGKLCEIVIVENGGPIFSLMLTLDYTEVIVLNRYQERTSLKEADAVAGSPLRYR